MKKIIAAALSILVGAFGYTIVDKALENRVANLESEIVELKEEVSRYHPQPISADTSKAPPLTGSTYRPTTYKPTTHRPTTSSRHTESTTPGLYPGKYISKLSDSKSKFLLRLYDDGDLVYLKPENYQEDMTRIHYNEYFLYLTESSAQIISVDTDEEYSYKYDNDYSLVSSSYDTGSVTIRVKYKGYTDPALVNRTIDFYTPIYLNGYSFSSYNMNLSGDEPQNNVIRSDGSFEYTKTLVLSQGISSKIHIRNFNGTLSYSIANLYLT